MNVFEFKNNSGTWLNIQMTRPDQYISRINPKSRIIPESRVKPESWSNPDSRINFDSWINYPIRIYSPIRPTFNTPLTRQPENTLPTRPTENNHQNIQMTRPDQDVSRVNPGIWIHPGSRINPESLFNPDSRIKSWELNQLSDSNQFSNLTNFQYSIDTKRRSDNFAPVGQFLRSVQLLCRSELTSQRGNSFAPAGQSLRSVQLLLGSKLTRRRMSFYVV